MATMGLHSIENRQTTKTRKVGLLFYYKYMSCKTQEKSETCFSSQSELTASTDNNLHINEYFLFWATCVFVAI